MLKEKGNLFLDYRHYTSITGGDNILPPTDGLSIYTALVNDKIVKITDVLRNQAGYYYLRTEDNNFQTYICTYESYQDFIYLLDYAEYFIDLQYMCDRVVGD